jgi:hypothetical protein
VKLKLNNRKWYFITVNKTDIIDKITCQLLYQLVSTSVHLQASLMDIKVYNVKPFKCKIKHICGISFLAKALILRVYLLRKYFPLHRIICHAIYSDCNL